MKHVVNDWFRRNGLLAKRITCKSKVKNSKEHGGGDVEYKSFGGTNDCATK